MQINKIHRRSNLNVLMNKQILEEIKEESKEDDDIIILQKLKNKHSNDDLQTDVDRVAKTIFDNKTELYKDDGKVAEFLESKNKEMGSYEVKIQNEKLQYSVKFSKLCISDQLKALMIVITDISDRLKHQETIISEKMKTIMIWSISHEIRSPLNQINGCLSLLQPTLHKPEQLKFI